MSYSTPEVGNDMTDSQDPRNSDEHTDDRSGEEVLGLKFSPVEPSTIIIGQGKMYFHTFRRD